jgi:hypothetical protein
MALVPAAIVEKIKADMDLVLDPRIAEKREFYDFCAANAAALKVVDPDTLAAANEMLKELLREHDGIEAVRKSGPGALDKIVKHGNGKFKPLRDTLDAAIANLKHEIGAFMVAQRKQQAENYQAAAAAHVAGNHEAAQVAMVVASEAITTAPQGSTVKEVWEVERYELGLMVLSTPEHPGLAPDEKAINAYLRALPAGEEPALPGVICRLVPAVSTRRA